MRNVPPGFTDPDSVLTIRINVPTALVAEPAEVAQVIEQIQRRIAAIAGVRSVGTSSSITMDGNDSNDPVFAEGVPTPEGRIPPLRRHKWVGENYFATMGNPVIAGRDLTWSDVHNRRQYAVLSENLARELFGEPQAAIGRRVRQTPSNPWQEVIGVVGNDYDDGVTQAATTTVYWPMLQENFWGIPLRAQRSMAYAIRTDRLRDPGFLREVQQAVWSVNPNLPLANVETLRDSYDRSMAQASFMLVILGIASGVTLLLGIVGIYGVIAYVVAQRRREVGIRMALGAAAGEVQSLFVRHGLVITGIGLAIGAGAAAALSRVLGALLFNVSPLDPLTYAAGIMALGLVAVIATWIPARQATRVDPAIALRGE
jgi:predicted permease